MGICPYCKKEIHMSDVLVEKKGTSIVGQERLYSCPFCNYIIGVSNVIRW